MFLFHVRIAIIGQDRGSIGPSRFRATRSGQKQEKKNPTKKLYLLLLYQKSDINSTSRENAQAPNRCNSLPCKVRTSRQRSCNPRVCSITTTPTRYIQIHIMYRVSNGCMDSPLLSFRISSLLRIKEGCFALILSVIKKSPNSDCA